MKFEAELFSRCPAWKSIYELEESLTLDEMFLLYRAANNIFVMNMKAQAAAAGGEVDWDDDDWYDPAPPKPAIVLEQQDLRFLPIGLGFGSE